MAKYKFTYFDITGSELLGETYFRSDYEDEMISLGQRILDNPPMVEIHEIKITKCIEVFDLIKILTKEVTE